TDIDSTLTGRDFALQSVGSVSDLHVEITPTSAFRPGFNAQYMIRFRNVGSTGMNPLVSLNLDDDITYVSSSVVPSSTSDSVLWQMFELLPYQEGQISVVVEVSEGAILGSILSSVA